MHFQLGDTLSVETVLSPWATLRYSTNAVVAISTTSTTGTGLHSANLSIWTSFLAAHLQQLASANREMDNQLAQAQSLRSLTANLKLLLQLHFRSLSTPTVNLKHLQQLQSQSPNSLMDNLKHPLRLQSLNILTVNLKSQPQLKLPSPSTLTVNLKSPPLHPQLQSHRSATDRFKFQLQLQVLQLLRSVMDNLK